MLLRLLLMATWAAWIWFEVVVVFGRTLLEHLRGRGGGRHAGALALLLGIAAAFAVAIPLSHLPAGALPGPAPVPQAAGLVLLWTGLALRIGAAWRRSEPPITGVLLAAAGFGAALGHWSSLLAMIAVAACGAGLACRLQTP